ncbi:methylated-DNA-[protein]-cysteine S-methyltransferase [Aquimarina sp. EL_43]|uniref:methylated-DNA--[protein]-cysteine S-methyltransferase n=1 Tax=Aquimarina TaxID=290174 RepID=UPI000472C169|nr:MULTISPECIES: methylated-DNA--[protein]-cysteine S-methyltransferase [Aquimarina]MBG6131468.1 methylated-DNA-[protein]-cysteine S-methyltransferase [Aquimarina sp. EL_35]MBG6151928.1 methylated-DNA-[protein]-cysteine S-methyltransferase [Aquimarina sp. EL_32]MBG6170128.1 methylated-DNA-[protein]-cysteine S-methyltransferase [Aquimarina sp. EL_43]
MDEVYVETPLGIATISGDEDGIASVSVTKEATNTPSKTIPLHLQNAVLQLKEYFDGQRTDFELTLNPSGTDFQKKVWAELLKIPFGKTVSYLDIAKKLGDPKTIRAAASANGKNPLWIIVPCHRVIGSDGSLTGYAGGLWRKKWLLDHENPVKQQSLF